MFNPEEKIKIFSEKMLTNNKKIKIVNIITIIIIGVILLSPTIKILTGYWVIGSDGLDYYAHLRSVMIDQDLNYENEFRDFNKYNHYVPDYNIKTETGYVKNGHPIGPALLWIPWFVIANCITYLTNIFIFKIPSDGYSMFYQIFIGIGSIIYGLLAIFFIYKITRTFFNEFISKLSILVILLSTNLIYYFINEQSMSHLPSLFCVSLFIYLWIRDYGKRTFKSYFWMGLVSGLMTLMRYQNVFFGVLILYELLEFLLKDKITLRKIYNTLNKSLIYFLGLSILLIPQLIVFKVIYGSFLINPYDNLGNFNFASYLVEVILSPNYGLVIWTPLILFSFIGMYYFTKDYKKIGLLFLLCFLIQWIIISSFEGWGVNVSSMFGLRHLIECSFIFVVGLGAFIKRFYNKNIFLSILFGIFIVWNCLLILQYITGLIPTDHYIDWLTIVKNQIKLVPYVLSKILSNF